MLLQRETLLFTLEKRAKLAQHRREEADIVVEVLKYPPDDLIHLLVQTILDRVRFLIPAHTGIGEFIEHLPDGMRFVAEELAVDDRDLQHRDLQSSDQGLDEIRQGLVVEYVIENHADDVDRFVIDLIDHPGSSLGVQR